MLYVVMLGGKHPKANIEVHDVVFVRGNNLADCYQSLRDQWFGSPEGLHIDAWMAVDGVDEYQVRFSQQAPASGEMRLYFLNLGGYQGNDFAEEHRYLLVVAPDKTIAKQLGKQRMHPQWHKSHTDRLLDVDDCIEIDCLDGRYIQLCKGQHSGITQQNDYIVLS